MIKVTVNGKNEEIEPLSVADFLESKNIEAKTVVVEHNRNILDKKEYETVLLEAGDTLEIIRFVGGG